MLLGWIGAVVGGVVLFGIMWWLEHLTGRTGATYIIAGVLFLLGGLLGILQGGQVIPYVLLIVGAGSSLFGTSWWLERRTARPGLMYEVCAFIFLSATVLGVVEGSWSLSLICAVQAVAAFYQAKWKRSADAEVDDHLEQNGSESVGLDRTSHENRYRT